MRPLGVLFVAMLLVALAPSAGAQVVAGPTDPVKAYEAGRAEYQAGRFADAIRDFQAADAATPSPTLIFNIAACYEKLADLRNARAAYVEYLRRSPEADDRNAVEATVASIDAQLAKEHEPAAPLIVTSEPSVVAPVAQPRPHRHLWSLVLLGAGGAGLLVGGGLQVGAWSQAHYPTTVAQPGPAVAGDYNSANQLLGGAIAGYSVGGALVIAGAIAYYLENRP